MSDVLVSVSGIRKIFPTHSPTGEREDFTAVENVSFEIERGGKFKWCSNIRMVP